jgi:hypothetical protein
MYPRISNLAAPIVTAVIDRRIRPSSFRLMKVFCSDFNWCISEQVWPPYSNSGAWLTLSVAIRVAERAVKVVAFRADTSAIRQVEEATGLLPHAAM